ncbi:helix-turn-helix domain-containing protein [Bradyrhizobium sp. HKCCYLS1011]|uniref:helix-turn-helix domain-containing protein n=1 Tax=Bradyrhizobium sp. HKCCYLS1011 TaxID=3420733 RepID=UPI003EBC6243
MKFGDIKWAQHDGAPPAILMTAAPRGESGVSLLRTRFAKAAYFNGTAHQHLIFLQLSPRQRLNCRMGGRKLVHEPGYGALAICPAGIDCSVDSEADMDTLLLTVDPRRLTLAAAEADVPQGRLNERLSGYDAELLAIVKRLVAETRADYPNGPLFWSEINDEFMSRLVDTHMSSPARPSRGIIGAPTLQRIRDYVTARLAEPIEVAELAGLAGRSPFHFTRAFARSVGMTPHRYVVHLRLQAAVARIREGRTRLADIAAETGFSDQSHLSRWIRRVHGVAPSDIGL